MFAIPHCVRAQQLSLRLVRSARCELLLSSRRYEAEQELECGICMELNATTVLNPSGHCVCCHEECGSASAAVCPMCNKAVTRIRI